jgi:hypothetical protein
MSESTNPWVVLSGQPALPQNYRATVGFSGVPYAPLQGQGAMSPALGTAITSPPIYTVHDLNSMWGAGQKMVWQNKSLLYDLGYLPAKDAALGFWTNASASALQNAMADANRNGTSLENMHQTLMSGGKLAYGPGGPNGSGAQTSVSTSSQTSTSDSSSISLTSREAAHAALSQQLANELGREPTNAELTRFLSALNGTERANPSTSHSVSTSSSRTVSGPGGSNSTGSSNSSSSSVSRSTDPGAEAQAWARKQTNTAAERNSYQQSGYFQIISKLMGIQ